MIVYELTCAQEHRFEAWFRDGATFDAQSAAGEIICPECGDIHVRKAPMAPRLNKTRGEAESVTPAQVRQVLEHLRTQVETNCDYVGDRFAEEARKIHYGETDARGIYGETTGDQARELAEEGVEFSRIPWLPRSDS